MQSVTELDGRVAEATGVIHSALERAGEPCVTSSFQVECVALVHMVAAQRPGHSGPFPRYRLPFRRDVRISGPHG